MLASILFLSPDGQRLLEGAAPSLPAEYNQAINGITIGPMVGSCGTAAFTGEAVFVSDIASDPLWTDFRDLALKFGLRACWSVPIRGEGGGVIGTFANYYREPKHPTDRDTQVIEMVAQTAAIAIERHRLDRARIRMDEQRDLLIRELNHRVKNVFALSNSLLMMTARSTPDPKDIVKAVQGRLLALSRAHELVQPGLSEERLHHRADVALADVVRDILAPYAIKDTDQRVELIGLQVRISADAITPVALVLHELATNAAKYGALSSSTGRVKVEWTVAGDQFQLTWLETGGPKPSKPEKTNFGTTLTRRSVEGQLGGTIHYDWRESGLTVTIALPLSAILAA